MNTQGFTLLETLIYIALFSVLMTGTLVTVYELLLSSEHNKLALAIQEEGTFLQRKINWALSGATTVTVSNAETLIITRPDLNSESPLVLRFGGGRVYLKRGGEDEAVLIGEAFVLSDVSITTIPAVGLIPTQVRVGYKINGVSFMYEVYLRF
jgi:prepilin-type N-terminal cleavage/methylation domain-containing protein